jgi:uncharacterized protein (TIGR02217 family)
LSPTSSIDELIAFFRARRGEAYGFRFKYWTDHKATGQFLGTAMMRRLSSSWSSAARSGP